MSQQFSVVTAELAFLVAVHSSDSDEAQTGSSAALPFYCGPDNAQNKASGLFLLSHTENK